MNITLNKNTLLTALLILFVVILIGQTIQLNGLSDKVKAGSFTKTSESSSISSQSSGSGSGQLSLPSNLQDLPGMVGGC